MCGCADVRAYVRAYVRENARVRFSCNGNPGLKISVGKSMAYNHHENTNIVTMK